MVDFTRDKGAMFNSPGEKYHTAPGYNILLIFNPELDFSQAE
jgi:hypothetical protein